MYVCSMYVRTPGCRCMLSQFAARVISLRCNSRFIGTGWIPVPPFFRTFETLTLNRLSCPPLGVETRPTRGLSYLPDGKHTKHEHAGQNNHTDTRNAPETTAERSGGHGAQQFWAMALAFPHTSKPFPTCLHCFSDPTLAFFQTLAGGPTHICNHGEATGPARIERRYKNDEPPYEKNVWDTLLVMVSETFLKDTPPRPSLVVS